MFASICVVAVARGRTYAFGQSPDDSCGGVCMQHEGVFPCGGVFWPFRVATNRLDGACECVPRWGGFSPDATATRLGVWGVLCWPSRKQPRV